MAVQFQNYLFKYYRNRKPVFAPSDRGRRIGRDIKAKVEAAYAFDSFVYHLQTKGGHVAAMHAHRFHHFFARVDISRFFYSIGRNRVQRALADIGVLRARHYAKWSCVRNPYADPSYALPYGFVQSPILATLVLMRSPVGEFLRSISANGVVSPSVYMDDILLSSDDNTALGTAFDELKGKLQEANFMLSATKERPPSAAMDVFNCNICHGKSEVQDERIALFFEEPRSAASQTGFTDYCGRVEMGNTA